MVDKKKSTTYERTIFTARFKSVRFKTDTKMMCRKSTSGLPQQTKRHRGDTGGVETAGISLVSTHQHFHLKNKTRMEKLAS